MPPSPDSDEEGQRPEDQQPEDQQPDDEEQADAEAERLVQEEGQAFDRAAAKARKDAEGLLRFVDEDLAKEGVVMPVFDNPLTALQYVAGIVETRRTAQDIRHRKKLIRHVRTFTVWWIGIVLALVTASGIDGLGFDLPTEAVVALVTTTTANVLGLAYIILRGMFDQDPPDHTPSSNADGN